MTRNDRAVAGNDSPGGSIPIQLTHGPPVETLQEPVKWPPGIDISRSGKDRTKSPSAFNLEGGRLWRRTVEQRGDEPERSAPASEYPDSGIRVQSHDVKPAAAGEIERKTRFWIRFVNRKLKLPNAECRSRHPELRWPQGRPMGV